MDTPNAHVEGQGGKDDEREARSSSESPSRHSSSRSSSEIGKNPPHKNTTLRGWR